MFVPRKDALDVAPRAWLAFEISFGMTMLTGKGNCEIGPSLTSFPFSQSTPLSMIFLPRFRAKNNNFDKFLMVFDSELSGFALF